MPWTVGWLSIAVIAATALAAARPESPPVEGQLFRLPTRAERPLTFATADRLETVWRERIAGSPTGAPIVDEQGRTVVATNAGRVVQLSAEGKQEWVRDAGVELGLPPVTGIDGTRYVLTTTTTLLGWNAQGSLTVRRVLSTSASPIVPPEPLVDGSLLVAAARDVLRLERDGRVRSRTSFPADVVGVRRHGRRIVVAIATGDVFTWSDPNPPVRAGTLRGRPTSDLVVVGDRAVALVGQESLVAVHLETGSRSVVAEGIPMDGIARAGRHILVASPTGSVQALDPSGQVRQAWSVWAPSPSAPARSRGSLFLLPSEGEGALLVAAGRGVAALSPTGASSWLEPAPCRRPLGASAAPRGAAVVACADGTVAMIRQSAEINKEN